MEENPYPQLCSYKNLELAFKRARKGKTQKDYIIEFEKDLKENLLELQSELLFHTYQPKPLKTFILRDPKTRKICVSDFRDRVIHHALCNIIEPIFERTFIYDSHANRKGKGTLKAIKRFDFFKRKVSKNNIKTCFILKADVKHYFQEVNHEILLKIIKKKIKDKKVLWLIQTLLTNHPRERERENEKPKGMPLGNLTSQFFANVYLDKLDQFVKHKLRVKYYIRYVDDFVILHKSKKKLREYKTEIEGFLQKTLALQLHPDKSRILPLHQGTEFLGLKIFPYHKLLKKKNWRKFRKRFQLLCLRYDTGLVDYDKIYDFLEGWCAYAKRANTYRLRKLILHSAEEKFRGEISTKEINGGLKIQKNQKIFK